eukprot:CAMPEP_0113326846 /NCGR_PEP_ID=MMETSP0010_2-20120614/18832_1 /TAXON_ID=216773 ORGANISM="Corethron hystrix, Strain 308" /NCGR_SAMPLE_ID=MMETSP0010_2 /ASSEMBLY_ACC=CAM_ASM_000155 /LENGTH=84 /DNA_ID=CAMNT_0000187391 /DNA_START=422 /DNA_END=677 /DNA_ORIENTATION=- /assembly_acc=CAM_ASM_000155
MICDRGCTYAVRTPLIPDDEENNDGHNNEDENGDDGNSDGNADNDWRDITTECNNDSVVFVVFLAVDLNDTWKGCGAANIQTVM